MSEVKDSQSRQENERKRSIFISHRHKDIKIANVFHDVLSNWSMNTIDIFQSSHPEGGPRVGQGLNAEIKNALAGANVVLLIYTYPDHDWSYCMWECGVATDPVDDKNTNIIVLSFTETSLGPFHDRVKISLTEDDIKKFTHNFHVDPKFFPGFSAAFAPNVTEKTISERSKHLFEKLRTAFPVLKRAEIRRWDMARLSLGIPWVREIQRNEGLDEAIELARKYISEECAVKEVFGEVARHFGYNTIMDRNYRFGELLQRWQDVSSDSPKQWIDGLYKEMTRTILNQESEPTWYLMKSARANVNWWIVPIVNHMRILPEEECIEFDVYFYRIPMDEEGRAKVGVTETSSENV